MSDSPDRSADPFLTWRPPGHFYSPVPSWEEVTRRKAAIWSPTNEVPGVDLREQAQRDFFMELADLVQDVDLPRDPTEGHRYYTNNVAFGAGDALMLNGMLRTVRPRRVIEIGSGHSSAWMLDTNERWLAGETEFTFMEPYPELLHSLLRPEDEAVVRIDPRPVQEIPTEAVSALASGDILFVDSTHVLKVDSDVRHIFARLLPSVPAGVYVHFHDIFWPFEYPMPWVMEGRAWTELYMLQAFLQYNAAFEIMLWNDWLYVTARDVIQQRLPRMLDNPGGSIWLRRTA